MEVSRILTLIGKFRKLKIAVVGDLILDRYLFGKVERISPEAPVPVFEIEREELKAGGAANVALNLRSLGVGEVLLLGRVGKDREGELLKKILQKEGVNSFLIEEEEIPTTRKTRIVARSQQLLRIDREVRKSLEEKKTRRLFEVLNDFKPDAVIVSDYAKGVITPALGNLLRDFNSPSFVDPRPKNVETYKGLFCMTPNLKEYSEMASHLGLVGGWEETAERFRRLMSLNTLVITLSEKGLALITDRGKEHFPATAREVYDVTGAGDTVIAALTAAFVAEKDWRLACRFANLCAGIAVSKLGTAQVSASEVLEELKREPSK